MIKAMDDYGVHIVALSNVPFPGLGTVSSAAPMLGFLGTVPGMITSFNDIVEQMGRRTSSRRRRRESARPC
ncbi:MAG: hypothetical protein Ct9H300mP1_17340 [Planctomycetaceae bacterium]|nr:MAG: hypothetical protein Ct9H300mP1_17340 [Planctomycetaceae bacterium]